MTALAGDLRRHRDGQPVKARPDTLGYRVGKFVRRNRVAVGAGVLVFASLVAGLAVAAWQARRAEAHAKTAAAAARRAEGVKEFLIGLFEVADPEQASGGSVTASELLDQAGKRLETELSSEPDIQADLLEAVARIDKGLGRLDTAEDLAKRSLEIRERILPAGDAAIGRSLATLGAVKMSQGKLDEAEKQITAALAVLEVAEAPDSLATARARSDFAQVLFWKGQAEPADRERARASTRPTGGCSATTTRRPPCTCAISACCSTRSTGSTRRRRRIGTPRRSSSSGSARTTSTSATATSTSPSFSSSGAARRPRRRRSTSARSRSAARRSGTITRRWARRSS